MSARARVPRPEPKPEPTPKLEHVPTSNLRATECNVWSVVSGQWSVVSVSTCYGELTGYTYCCYTRLTAPRCALRRCAPSKHSPSN